MVTESFQNNGTRYLGQETDSGLEIDSAGLSFDPPAANSRRLQGQTSIILARTGERVRRSYSSFSVGFENSADSNEGLVDANVNETSSLLPKTWINRKKSWLQQGWASEQFRSVVKCSLAYVIASMAVYWRPFNEFLGQSDSKHLVATVAVYFHPSRSKGSMHQSLGYVIVSMVFSCLTTFGCRSISGYFFNHGEDEICYTIDLVISSMALGIIAFMKQKINKPTFNTACSLASISVVACIIKEGAMNASEIPVERVQSTLTCVIVGCGISILCCYLIWPVNSVHQLRGHLNDSFNIMSALLSITVNRFLIGEKISAKDAEWFNRLNANISSLNNDLEEAQYELKLKGRIKEYQVFVKIVSTTKSLARHLQALRSSVEMQWSLMHENENNNNNNNDDDESISSQTSSNSVGGPSLNSSNKFKLSQSVENMSKIPIITPSITEYSAKTSVQLFDLFVFNLGPSIKSFIFTLKGILSEVPFENYNQQSKRFAPTEPFRHSLLRAKKLYTDKQSESFKRLYAQDIFKDGDYYSKTDQEEVTACCGNFVSLVGEFSNELMNFLEIVETYEIARTSGRSWKFWNHNSKTTKSEQGDFNEALDTFRMQYESSNTPSSSDSGSPTVGINQQLISYKIWEWLKVFNRTDTQFGIRVGLGAFGLAIFAFMPKTKFFFNEWRGEWALAIYCIMMNKSVGGTKMTIKWRILGTFIGCYGAYFLWWLTNGNVYVLSLGGFMLAIPSFHIIMYWKQNNAFGRFILLAYNLTALYSYSMTQKDSEDGLEGGDDPIIGDIAFHRFASVTVGIVWALMMANLFLPNSARTRLKKGLTILWLRMGVIWDSDPLEYDENKLEMIGLKDQKGLHDILEECKTLLKQAPLEFRLKGQFPTNKYDKILAATSNIIDAYSNMNLLIEADMKLSTNEVFVLQYIEQERREVEHRIFLVFYMIASALRLGFPVPDKPASMEHAKDRLLIKLSEIRSHNIGSERGLELSNEDYVLLYSYILVTNKITTELDKILELVKELLGKVDEDIFHLV